MVKWVLYLTSNISSTSGGKMLDFVGHVEEKTLTSKFHYEMKFWAGAKNRVAVDNQS